MSDFKPVDRFLINNLNALPRKASRAKRTPYPQKRQQRLGVILT
ncbi:MULTISPECIES: hypothetical protein [Pseudomonas]|jgi:hypothetical protein|nr:MULTISPECIES: hypothetical protein [Pseudomonas]MDT8908608.1 hypothetical protein [Pseudomonas prosekii]